MARYLRLSVGIVLAFAALTAGLPPARANDALKFRVTTLTPRAYCYWKFSNAARTIQAGDYLEYDVYLNSSAVGVGGIDVRNTDGTYWRDCAGWADQNGVGGHPGQHLTSWAYRKWYHRKLPVPAAVIGKTTSWWDLALDGWSCGVWECYSAVYDNVRITNGGATVRSIYTDGSASLNQQDFALGGSIQSANLLCEPTRRTTTQVATHFFYWYDAATQSFYDGDMVFDPRGLYHSPWSGYGTNGYYTTLNTDWWEGEFQDVKRAGVDVAALICWGDVPGQPWFQTSVLSTYMVPALERSGVGVKIAMFDDTTSEVCLWNYNNGRGWQADNKMPLSDTANWAYFYDTKIKPFFQAIPQKLWATHNGLPPEQGGRPVIYTYTSGWFADVSTHGASLWQYVKTSFANDFKDANGVGITPFVIHEMSWVNGGGGSTGDSAYAWGAALFGPSINRIGSGANWTCEIGAGYDDRLIRSPGNYKDRQRQQTLVQWYNGTYSSRKVWESSFITVETWNELWEGTGIDRSINYPDPWGSPGAMLSETFYIDTFRTLIQSSVGIRDNDATFLRTWQIPTGTSYMANGVTVNLRNDGMLPWEPGTHSLGGRLLNTITREVIPGSERALAAAPAEVLGGGECQITFTVPHDWPTGGYILQLDMMQGPTWFASLGDTPVSKSVSLTRPKPTVYDDGTYTSSATSLHVSWAWSDSQSTVVGYQYAAGTSPSDPGSGYLVGWTDAGAATSATINGLSLTNGATYYFYVKARNAAGVWSDSGASNGIMVDATPPSTPAVTDDGAYTTSTNTLHATWTTADPESGLNNSIYAIGTSPVDPGSGYVVNWTSVASYLYVTRTALTLASGTTYYFYVKARNKANAWSAAGVSNGIMAVRPFSRISEVRALSPGSGFVLPEKLVAGATDGAAFLEEPDRSCGIRLNWSGAPPNPAARAVAAGKYLGIVDNEPTAGAVAIDPGSSGGALPLGMTNASIGWPGAGTPPHAGPDTRDLLVRVWGRVTYSSSTFLLIDDGSGVCDWLSTLGKSGIKVSLPAGAAPPAEGRCVSITGISRASSDGRRWLMTRTANDVVVW